MNNFHELAQPVEVVAPRLLGCILEREIDGTLLRVRIVEVEAYHQEDPASHAVTGPAGRAAVMFGPAGRLYVYFTYGMHYCCNVTADAEGVGAGVLIRAVEPLEGEEYMVENRGGKTGVVVTNGPGKVCQALLIDKRFNGHDLQKNPVRLLLQPPLDPSLITQTKRIGIAKGIDTPWRFYINDNPYVSRPH